MPTSKKSDKLKPEEWAWGEATVYGCPVCGASMDTKDLAQRHIDFAHPETPEPEINFEEVES